LKPDSEKEKMNLVLYSEDKKRFIGFNARDIESYHFELCEETKPIDNIQGEKLLKLYLYFKSGNVFVIFFDKKNGDCIRFLLGRWFAEINSMGNGGKVSEDFIISKKIYFYRFNNTYKRV